MTFTPLCEMKVDCEDDTAGEWKEAERRGSWEINGGEFKIEWCFGSKRGSIVGYEWTMQVYGSKWVPYLSFYWNF